MEVILIMIMQIIVASIEIKNGVDLHKLYKVYKTTPNAKSLKNQSIVVNVLIICNILFYVILDVFAFYKDWFSGSTYSSNSLAFGYLSFSPILFFIIIIIITNGAYNTMRKAQPRNPTQQTTSTNTAGNNVNYLPMDSDRNTNIFV